MSSDDEDVRDRLGRAIADYQAAVDDFDRECARVLGVNETDLRCLEVLMRDEPDGATPRLLADRLGLTTGSVTGMLDRLEQRGYVTRSPHPTDRRRLVVRATDAVVARSAEVLAPLLAEGQRDLLSRYTSQQLGLVAEFLTATTEFQRIHVDRLRARSPYPRA
ncbi:MarR family transcriptional regulator [Tsukamurella sp. 8F]|uniref:MarR family winged helix-turn-helix transcriptional regulator n=1 Tax=unclassified Tsukamurella TaxID=2633480 RepID=UPI0023BA144D|nr:MULTISPECIES: MarR family transcriptional regulator [unclassified Tsukamurella]MDF0531423.1 MarR family transcriptional regulator [Tsukamurella sp. 8J]MDF0585271.1 MarR family transcriptional regulator [Tsukamurella sp. 8F]